MCAKSKQNLRWSPGDHWLIRHVMTQIDCVVCSHRSSTLICDLRHIFYLFVYQYSVKYTFLILQLRSEFFQLLVIFFTGTFADHSVWLICLLCSCCSWSSISSSCCCCFFSCCVGIHVVCLSSASV